MKANRFFFLTAVDSQINASVHNSSSTTFITFTHQDDRRLDNRLLLEVVRCGDDSFTVAYDYVEGNVTVKQSKSEPILASSVYGVIAAIANDTFTR